MSSRLLLAASLFLVDCHQSEGLEEAAAMAVSQDPVAALIQARALARQVLADDSGSEIPPDEREARALFGALLAADSCNTDALLSLAELTAARQAPTSPHDPVQPDEAEALLRRAFACQPQDLDIGDQLGSHLIRSGRQDDALAWYHQLYQDQSEQVLWAIRWAELLSTTGHHEEALQQAQKALIQHPDAPPERRMKLMECAGRAAAHLGRFELAARHLEGAVALAEDDFLEDPRRFRGCAFQALGTLYREAGQPERGLDEYLRAADGEPASAYSQWAAASAALELDRHDLANEYAGRAVKLEPGNSDYRNLQARVTHQLALATDDQGALPPDEALVLATTAFERYAFDQVEDLAARGQRDGPDHRLRCLEAMVLLLQQEHQRAALRVTVHPGRCSPSPAAPRMPPRV